MEIDSEYFERCREKALTVFRSTASIYNPYLNSKIILNSDGFHHLQFSSRHERNKREQFLKFRLLTLALEIIKKSGTVQEYRKILSPVGKKSPRNGAISMKNVEYYGFVAIVGENKIKVKTIVRRIGDGQYHFWSVMPYSKIKNGQQKLCLDGIEDD